MLGLGRDNASNQEVDRWALTGRARSRRYRVWRGDKCYLGRVLPLGRFRSCVDSDGPIFSGPVRAGWSLIYLQHGGSRR